MRKLYSRFYTLTISVLPSRFRASIWQTSSLLMHCITLPFLLQSSSEYPTQVKHFIAGNRSARTVFVISKRKKTTDNIIFIVFSYIFSRSNELQSHRKRGFCTCKALMDYDRAISEGASASVSHEYWSYGRKVFSFTEEFFCG